MVNVFIGTLIIQVLFGFAFKTYFYLHNRYPKVVYSSLFNSIFALLVVLLVALYAYALKNHKKKITQFQKVLTDHLKYVFILNVIAFLLAQICLIYMNQAYLQINPEKHDDKISRLARERGLE